MFPRVLMTYMEISQYITQIPIQWPNAVYDAG